MKCSNRSAYTLSCGDYWLATRRALVANPIAVLERDVFRPDLAVTAVRINNVRHLPCITRHLVTVAVSTNSCRVYLESQSALFGGWRYCDPTAKDREQSRSTTAILQIHTYSDLIIAIDHTRLRLLSAANRITHARWGRTSLFFPSAFFPF